jgi:imidazolonepropionase-like amidohydrolase
MSFLNTLKRTSLVLCLSASFVVIAPFTSAQDIAIVGGTVHTMSESGKLENATVLIRDGRIVDIGSNITVPVSIETIDAKGKQVTPGFIGAFTSIGLVEVSSWAGTVDSTSTDVSVSPTGAALDVSYAINPDSSLIGVNRIEGFTTVATAMRNTGTLFNGQGALMSLADSAQLIDKPRAFIVTGVDNGAADRSGGSRAALWVSLQQALEEAKSVGAATLSPVSEWHGLTSKADARALSKVIAGDVPLLVSARRASDIRQVIALKQRFSSLDITLLYATEGWRLADEIAAAGIDVILDVQSNLPYSFDQLGATMANAGRLHKAGVSVAIGIDTHNIRLARQEAGNAVANGLPWEAGLASLTTNVAKIYGVEGSVGSLEKGKRGNVVVWSGDPLEVMEIAEQVIIDGEMMSMESRQTKLRDRYLKRSNSVPVQHTRP